MELHVPHTASSAVFTVYFDDEMAEWVLRYRWNIHVAKSGLVYARTNWHGPDGFRTTLLMHTFITGWNFVDHIDHDGLNNVRGNLRPSTHKLNSANSRSRCNGGSRYKGVRWHTRDKVWESNIMLAGRQVYLGRFEDEVAAARAYDAAAQAEHGDHAFLNFGEHGIVACHGGE